MDNYIEFLYSKFLQSDGVCTDTRKISKGNMFFALKGPNFNGNKYAEAAIEAGAKFAVVDEKEYDLGEEYILVEDVLTALQDLARFYRSRFKNPVFGLTGSNGKTTTKELINEVLSKKYITSATAGNLNNHIGVPLTVLDILPQTEIAIVEMGASAVGEIALLSSICDPDAGLITNIGKAHTETFGGIEGVIRGKSELFDHLRKKDAQVFINQNDKVLSNMAKRFPTGISYPPVDLMLVSANPFLVYSVGDKEVVTNLIGDYNFDNIGAAVAIGRYYSVPENDIHQAISQYTPTNNRSQVVKEGSNQIIQDAYNANPDSMKAAVVNLSNLDGKKVAILGDMNELEDPEEEHKALGELVGSLNFDQVIFCGKQIEAASKVLPGSLYFGNTSALIDHLSNHKFENSSILVKASRGLQFEKLYDHF
ncbi:MAG: UDP-N-acetylmuramoyl-tripeptide--D-alanyl-D-alanine ligase [bacterium]|nr:UDP-N-acetylmuramoyl-tripeptide--D-alanyl-D-alanine ligase [bacterium]